MSDQPMTPAEFARLMREAMPGGDPEMEHINADELMIALLRQLGYGEGCDVFEDADRWYA